MLKHIIILLFTLILCVPAFAAVPQSKGLYFGLNAGYGKIDEKVSNSHKQDNSDWGASGDLGYQFNPYFALEGTYSWLPDEKFDEGVEGDKNFSVALALKGILPFSTTGFSLFGKVGGAAVHHRLKDTVLMRVDNEGSYMRPAFYAGVGASYAVTKNLAFNIQATGTSKYGNDVPATYLITGGATYILPESMFQ